MSDATEESGNSDRGKGLGATSPAYSVTALAAYLGALLALTGVQLLSPAIPLLQREFGLTDAAANFITSTYLLPSILSALAAGYLSDRYGRRVVYVSALVGFGVLAPVPLVFTTETAFFAVRFIQGTMFGAILPLSMIVLGDVVRVREQLRAQATRNLAMGLGDSLFPMLGGVLLALGDWRLVIVFQMLTLPVAVLAWRVLPTLGEQRLAGAAAGRTRVGREVILSAPAVSLMLGGFLRFLLKFGLTAYLPLLLVRNGASVTLTGVAVGVASVLTIAVNLVASALGRLQGTAFLNFGCLVGMGAVYLVLALTTSFPLHLAVLALFGLFDSLMGLVHNAYLVTRFDTSTRSIVAGYVVTSRNAGKAMAPVIMGAVVAFTELPTTFMIMGVLALAASPTSVGFRRRPS